MHLAIEDVRRVEQLVRVAEAQGARLNFMLTVRVPSGSCDGGGKRRVHDVTRALFQSIRRRRKPTVAVTIYERRRRSQDLHAHVLVHVPRSCTDLIWRRHVLPERHVRSTDEKAVSYVTKQRWAPPVAGGFFERGDDIPGPRVALTRHALDLLEGRGLPKVVLPRGRTDTQLPCRLSDIPATLKAFRKAYGLSQKAFYGTAGISRGHGANVERGHDRLSRTVMLTLLDAMRSIEAGRCARPPGSASTQAQG